MRSPSQTPLPPPSPPTPPRFSQCTKNYFKMWILCSSWTSIFIFIFSKYHIKILFILMASLLVALQFCLFVRHLMNLSLALAGLPNAFVDQAHHMPHEEGNMLNNRMVVVRSKEEKVLMIKEIKLTAMRYPTCALSSWQILKYASSWWEWPWKAKLLHPDFFHGNGALLALRLHASSLYPAAPSNLEGFEKLLVSSGERSSCRPSEGICPGLFWSFLQPVCGT